MTERLVRSPWLPFGSKQDASVRLLCLPHAGAGATVYRTWASGLPGWIGACPVQPPGREKRRSEPILTAVRPLVESLAPDVAALVRPPYAIFGHSTGALCSFELIHELRRIGGPLPVHLFVAGRRAPQIPMDRTPLEGLSIEELTVTLRNMGGTPEEILADRDMVGLIRPMLIADFSVNESYSYTQVPALDLPITAFAGASDPGANVSQLAAWKEQTSARFHLHTLGGGHFAVFDHASDVLAVIAESLRPYEGAQRC
ncbi:MAG TPA: thioesterase domain-containing protein [Streptosporangiaceae bacterium]|nr:thioesterase domain-containing protein [Streptosporangiaceae bacterium]